MLASADPAGPYRSDAPRARYEQLLLRTKELRALRHEKEAVDGALRTAALDGSLPSEALLLRRQALEASLVGQEAVLRELAHLRALLGEKVSLHQVKIARPCAATWSAMDGDDRRRHCGDCNKNVYNLSGLTQTEAEEFLALHEATPVCVRIYRRPDGTAMTADCPKGIERFVRRVRGRTRVGFVATALLALGGVLVRVLNNREAAAAADAATKRAAVSVEMGLL